MRSFLVYGRHLQTLQWQSIIISDSFLFKVYKMRLYCLAAVSGKIIDSIRIMLQVQQGCSRMSIFKLFPYVSRFLRIDWDWDYCQCKILSICPKQTEIITQMQMLVCLSVYSKIRNFHLCFLNVFFAKWCESFIVMRKFIPSLQINIPLSFKEKKWMWLDMYVMSITVSIIIPQLHLHISTHLSI